MKNKRAAPATLEQFTPSPGDIIQFTIHLDPPPPDWQSLIKDALAQESLASCQAAVLTSLKRQWHAQRRLPMPRRGPQRSHADYCRILNEALTAAERAGDLKRAVATVPHYRKHGPGSAWEPLQQKNLAALIQERWPETSASTAKHHARMFALTHWVGAKPLSPKDRAWLRRYVGPVAVSLGEAMGKVYRRRPSHARTSPG